MANRPRRAQIVNDPVLRYDANFDSVLGQYDGFVFGLPSRFGQMCVEMKHFFDMTVSAGHAWRDNLLTGKPAALISSSSSQGGGAETTCMSAVSQLTALGMVYIPLGYTSEDLLDMSELHGASPWGAHTYSGADGGRFLSAAEKRIATFHGQHVGNIMGALAYGMKSKNVVFQPPKRKSVKTYAFGTKKVQYSVGQRSSVREDPKTGRRSNSPKPQVQARHASM